MRAAPASGELLRLDDATFGYGGVAIVRGAHLTVCEGEIVTLLGANGAGKTTLIRGCAGLIRPMSGVVSVLGRPGRRALHLRARDGLALLPDSRAIIPSLSVGENLRLAGVEERKVTEIFPELTPLLRRRAGLLSGGEQQILVLGRLFASGPRLLLADELSLGLAPLVVARLLSALRKAADAGAGVLLVEQQVRHALSVAERAYVLRLGSIVLEGSAKSLRDQPALIEAHYF